MNHLSSPRKVKTFTLNEMFSSSSLRNSLGRQIPTAYKERIPSLKSNHLVQLL